MKPKHINIWTRKLYNSFNLENDTFSKTKVSFNAVYNVQSSKVTLHEGLAVETNSIT